jgi:hypothetical protein
MAPMSASPRFSFRQPGSAILPGHPETAMDAASIATSMMAARADQTRATLAARMMAMDAKGDAALLGLLRAAAQQGTVAAAPSDAAPGAGARLDIRV